MPFAEGKGDETKRGWKKFPIRKGKGEKGGLEMMSYNSKVRVRQWFKSQYKLIVKVRGVQTQKEANPSYIVQ